MWNPKKYHQGGEIMVDHRASPGIPSDIARQIGYDPGLVGEGKLMEQATLTCSHCKCSVVKNPLRVRPRERCEKCDHYVCDLCYSYMQHPDYIHTPYEKLQEKIINAGHQGVVLGSSMKLLLGIE